MPASAHFEERACRFTVVRARGLEKLRAERSWRPVVAVTVGSHQCHELNLGCDGQNPNLKQHFQFHEVDASSRIDISVYHLPQSKKKNKKRNLVASACYTLQELARLQAQQQSCKQKGVEIKLHCISSRKGGANKAKPSPVLLVANLELPVEGRKAQLNCVEDEDLDLDVLSDSPEDQGYSSSSASDSSEDPTFVWPEDPVDDSKPKVHNGYWSASDDIQSGDELDPLLKHPDNDPFLVSQPSDSEDGLLVKNRGYKLWFAASILPAYTETISINSQVSSIDSIVDSFSPYRELREARLDSEYERVLSELCTEWRFVGGSLVALSGLEAGVFGFSAASAFTINNFARRAIAVGSVASGIGLAIDAWFLLAYSNTTAAKFQKMALDVYGKYLFFCISARVPALCMFTSALALMIFLLSVAWSAWPTAVLVMSFVAGILVSLQFIVYGMHCAAVLIADVMRTIRRSILRYLAWLRPPPPDVREKNTVER